MTESEEMYLLSIAILKEAGVETPIPVSQLARELSIQPISANQMVRKLEMDGLVLYAPYKGVELTNEGEQVAMRVLRHRRLWEVFLVEQLKIPLSEANKLACRMEHIIPTEASDRLASFLGEPQASPQGKPIPKSILGERLRGEILLSQHKIGEQVQVTRIDSDESTRAFLNGEGVIVGATVTILGIGGDGACLVGLEHRTVYLTKRAANVIWVKIDDLKQKSTQPQHRPHEKVS